MRQVDIESPFDSRYSKLAKQVVYMRMIIPPALALFVVAFEFFEHTVMHNTPLTLDFYLELILFGLLGPFLIAIIFTWIIRNLHELEQAYRAIHDLNTTLEQKVAERTAELHHANQELRKLDQLKSEFVSLVSHELRAPLTNIQGGLELVQSNHNSSCQEHLNLNVIQDEVKRLIRLVKRILDVSVLESGQVNLNIGPIALRPLIDQVIEQIGMTNDTHIIRLHIPSQLPLTLADEEHLTDILTSLLQNAIKYSPDGGFIDIRLIADDKFTYVSIKDQGVGIVPQDIPHLTEKFYRGQINNQTNGYGLGLYFVNELIKAQGGWLTIESDGIAGHGATFTFSIPLESETLYELDSAY